MSWSKKYKKNIDCSNPKGFSQKAHCAGRKARQSGKDTKSKSVSEMKLSQLKEIIRKVVRGKMVSEAITNSKKSNPNDLATTVIGWYDFATDYIDDGGQRRRAEKSNDDVVKWFDSHPLDIKQKAFKVMLSKQPSLKSKIQRIFGSSLKESVNEDIEPQTKKIASLTGTRADAVKQFVSANALNITKLLKFIEKGKLSDRMDFVSAISGKPNNPIQKKIIKMFSESVNEVKTYKKGDKLKIKLPNGKKFDVVFDSYSRTKGVGMGKFKDGSGEYDIKPFNLDTIVESVNEATEPEIISQLKDIVKNQQYQTIKDPKSGKKMKVDMQTANAVLQIYNGLSNVNKDNMVKMGLPKMIEVAWKIINKYKK